MMTEKMRGLSKFQKVMVVVIPIIVLLLIASVVTFAAMMITHHIGGFGIFSPGNIVIVMALCASALAIIGIVFAIVSADKDEEE